MHDNENDYDDYGSIKSAFLYAGPQAWHSAGGRAVFCLLRRRFCSRGKLGESCLACVFRLNHAGTRQTRGFSLSGQETNCVASGRKRRRQQSVPLAAVVVALMTFV